MSYERQAWSNGPAGSTPLSAERLTHMEAGVANAYLESAAFAALSRSLEHASRSCAIQILGDSTGNDTTDWPYRLAQALATDYPAWTVRTRLWSDSTQLYGSAVTIQTGTAGERYLDGSTGDSPRRLAASQSSHLTGTIDVRVRMNLTDWTPSSQINFVGRSGSTGTRGWYFLISTSGTLTLAYSTDGTAVATMAATAATGITDGTTSWVRCVFIPNDGSGNRVARFYKGTDGAAWTQIGSTVTTSGAVTLNNPNLGFELGGVAGSNYASLKVYEVEIRNGENGPTVTPCLPDLWPPYTQGSSEFVGAPTLMLVNGSHPGADISYLGDSTRLPKMTPDYGQLVAFLSTSHNEGLAMGREWTALYETWRDDVASLIPGAPLVALTQNPERTGALWWRMHDRRRIELLAYARSKGLPFLDTYQAFLDYGDWSTDLLGDNVHPNAAGSDLWRDTVKAAIDSA